MISYYSEREANGHRVVNVASDIVDCQRSHKEDEEGRAEKIN
jgi:hypothetical protein